MKIYSILLGAFLIAIAAISSQINNEAVEAMYSSRHSSLTNESNTISEAFDFYKLLRANVNTGEIMAEDIDRAKKEVEAMIKSGHRASINFISHGPDNIGGRTRAILIDKNDYTQVYAGSVSGGLFKSTNRGSTWHKVESFESNLAVSSMCQTDDGTIYVATGHSIEMFDGNTQDSGMNGDGIYYSSDNGQTFNHLSGSEANSFINKVVAKGNSILIAGSEGLQEYNNGVFSNLTTFQSGCKSLVISEDNQVIVASFFNQRTWVSTDGGENFTAVYGNGPNQIPSGKSRIEYAISHEKVNGKYYVYASMSQGGVLAGVYKSIDNGMTWSEIAPANNGLPGSFAPFGPNRQGWYDQIISVVKGDPETCLLGGINIHAKSTNGNWQMRSLGGVASINPLYVHADQHEMQWDSEGRLWIGNDGGVFYSDDNGHTFRQANRGYSVTQFYRVAASAHGDVAGGTQDNGTPGNYHDNHTYRDHKLISGNDGFSVDFSFMNRDVVYSTSQFGRIFRTANRGGNLETVEPQNIPASLGTPLVDLGSFYTVIELYENPNDVNSQDTIYYSPNQSYNLGDVISIPSMTSQQTISHILTEDVTFQDSLFADTSLTIVDTIVFSANGTSINLYNQSFTYIFGTAPISVGDTILVNGVVYPVNSIVLSTHYFGTNPNEPGEIIDMGGNSLLENISWDTIAVTDPYQSWLAFGLGNGGGLWLTRNALRFSASHDGFIQAGGNIQGVVTEMEFSKDGNHLFVGTSTGALYRLSGLSNIYSPNPVLGSANGNVQDTSILWDPSGSYTTETTFELIQDFIGPVTGISIEKGDPNHVVVSLGAYANSPRVMETTNATASTISFNSIVGNLPTMPCLSILMDRNNSDVIFVGTDFGLWRSEDGGGIWEYCDSEFGKTPIFDLRQNWRTWDEGCHKPGQIYIGTHGRGIWTTDEYLSIDEAQDNTWLPDPVSNIKLYPNPVINTANIVFKAKGHGKGRIAVYNLQGKLVMDIHEVGLSKGENTLPINLGKLPRGTYFVNLTTEWSSNTVKFIKQ